MGEILRKKGKKGSLSKYENVSKRIRVFKNWYKVVFPFNRVFKGMQKLRLRNGAEVYVREVRSMDTNIAMDVLWTREYDLEDLTLPKNPIIFDIGANIGTFCMEINRVFPDAHIVAYEPFPGSFAMLKINAPFAVLHQKAAAGKTGKVQFENGKNFVGLHIVSEGGITVDAESLEDILKDTQTVDLLKIDIEGGEYELLENASLATLAKVQRIVMETHDSIPNDLEWGENILRKHGFRTHWIDPAGIIYGERD